MVVPKGKSALTTLVFVVTPLTNEVRGAPPTTKLVLVSNARL